MFWSSVELAGNQTTAPAVRRERCFGAVSNWLVIKLGNFFNIVKTSFGAVSNWLVIKLLVIPIIAILGFGAVSNWLVIKLF